jgi:hypothetical protein
MNFIFGYGRETLNLNSDCWCSQASAVERAERLAREAQTRSIALENELIQTRVVLINRIVLFDSSYI